MFARILPTWRTPLSLPFFDYAVPADIATEIKVGQLVTVPFRNKEEFGVVLGLADKPSMPVKNIKSIKSIIHPEPFISSPQMAFLQELAELYHVSPGFLIQGNLPPLQKRKLAKLDSQEIKKTKKQESKFGKPALCTYKNNDEKQKYLNDAIAKDGQTLIIVPEIADIQRLVGLLPTTYSLLTITSDLSDKEYFERWFQVWSGEKQVVVGTRRALFMSFNNLTSVIVDDEGSSGHKSWDMAPRFHAREAALYLAKHHGATLSLLSNCPSMESYYFAKHGVFNCHFESPVKGGEKSSSQKPALDSSSLVPRSLGMTKDTTIVDMTGETRAGNKTGLCQEVQDAITELTDGFVFLFLNRRGSGGYVHCKECGNVLKCKNCGRSYTYHEKKNELACHFCKITEPMAIDCGKCGGTYMSVFGTGTEQLERDVQKLAGSMPVIRIDSDSKEITVDSNKGVIIATEYGWQKVPWDKVTTMVFVDPDTSLFIPEYRAAEELWQKINNALYRLSPISSLIIQTKHPEHTIFTSLANPDQFYESELTQRRLFGYPPFNYILKLFNSAPSVGESRSAAEALYRKLAVLTKNIANCTITPPLESSPFFHDKKYWHVLVVKVPYTHYKRDIKVILKQVPDSWKVDLNPNSLLGW